MVTFTLKMTHMKRILLLFLLPLSTLIYGQTQIENGGFEGVWEDVSGSEDEPEEWSSLKTADALAALAPIVVFKSTDAHTGTYSVRLKNTTSFGVVANGIMTNGRVHADFDPELGNVFTHETEPDWNLAFNDRPDSLVAWVMYSPEGSDRGKIEVLLHNDSDDGILPETGATDHWVGKARYDVEGTITDWQRVSVPFTYYTSGLPDFALVVVSSGDSTIAVDGSEMWIDDIELIYNPNTVVVTPGETQYIDIDVDGDELTVEETPNAAVVDPVTREWKYSETAGGPYTSFDPTETETTYTPNFDTPGIYFVVCESDFGTEVVVSNEVEIVVSDPAVNSVTISPAAAQTFLVDEDGDLLTATESPEDADSREWKYSETEGTDHVAFDPAETGMTYLPNFASVGTYYVICESDFGGDIQQSNEVTIMVPSAAGIQTDELTFNIYQNADQLMITMSDFENAIFALYGLDGKQIYQTVLGEENSIHQINTTGAFVYQVRKNDRIITGKIVLQ